MALQNLIWTKPETPYYRPPPLHVCVVAAQDQPRAVSWEFVDSTAKPAVIKKNKIVAITDGKTVAKITLFEEFASKFSEGNSYILRGHTLRGQSPPYSINITRNTQLFRASPVAVTQELVKEGKGLLQPASILTPLNSCGGAAGLLTVEGEVVEMSAVKKIVSGREAIPLRNILLQRDSSRVSLSLWREAATRDFELGCQLRVSHLKSGNKDYGLQLQSTNYTTIEEISDRSEDTAEAIGVTESSKPGFLELLLASDAVYEIEESMWHPFEGELIKGPLKIKVEVSGKKITAITADKVQQAQ